jgi:hypothetical protein
MTGMASSFVTKTENRPRRVAEVRYAHGDELSRLPGVTGVGIGKDHIIVYVENEHVEVPKQMEQVPIIKIRRT